MRAGDKGGHRPIQAKVIPPLRLTLTVSSNNRDYLKQSPQLRGQRGVGEEMITQGELNIIEQRLSRITPGEWLAVRTASRDWWITAPCESDSEYVDEYEPIFESSGTTPQFGIDAEFIATAPAEMRKLVNSIYELLAKL